MKEKLKELEFIILENIKKYPRLEPSDLIKLVFQNEFGGGHLVTDKAESLERIKTEIGDGLSHGQELAEYIGNGISRVNLWAVAKDSGVTEAVNLIFVASWEDLMGTEVGFRQKLNALTKLAGEGKLPFSQKNCEEAVDRYLKEGVRPIGHSQRYKDSYSPAYRVVLDKYLLFLPLITKIVKRLAENERLTVVIDGYCGSGKSTLAVLLAKMFDSNIIAVDDFFLPAQLRTPERLAEPGGNVHYERLESQVMVPLGEGTTFEYDVFDCRTMSYNAKKKVTPKPLTIIEGSYSQHPKLGGAGIKVFVRCSENQQQKRILARSGKELYEDFIDRWIPMENRYFKEFSIEENCDLVFDTSEQNTV